MGKVVASIRVSNAVDQIRSAEGNLEPEAVRSEALTDVLVDTGATLLSLPADGVRRLGLPSFKSGRIMTATGPVRPRICQGVLLEVEGRSMTFDCVELPEGAPALLGVVPLEALGIELDLRNQRLWLIPDDEGEGYLTAL